MKLKGVRALCRSYNGVFALSGEARKVNDAIYGDLHNLPEELVDLPLEHGYYTIDGEMIDLDSWVDPVDWLPIGLVGDWKYVAMDRSGRWYLYPELPVIDEGPQMFKGSDNYYDLSGLFKTYPDPLGWRQSLHVRDEDGNWKRF